MESEDQKQITEPVESCRCAVITVSDTRTIENDESGLEILRQLQAAGHRVVERTVVPEDPGRIALVLRHWLAADVEAILLSGDTDVLSRDSTVDIVRQFLERELPGFGEIFSFLSYRQIGPSAMFARVIAGTARGKLVLTLPAGKQAVRLGMEKLIVPGLRHAAYRLRT